MKYALVFGASFAMMAAAAPAPTDTAFSPFPEPTQYYTTPCTLAICTNPASEPTQFYPTTTAAGWTSKPVATTTSSTTKDNHGWGKSSTTTSSTTKDDHGWGKKTTTTAAKKTTTTAKDHGWGKSTTTTPAGGKWTTPAKPYTVQSTITKDGKTWVTPVVVTPTAVAPAHGGDNSNNGGKPGVATYTGAAAAHGPIAAQAVLGGVLAGAAFLL